MEKFKNQFKKGDEVLCRDYNREQWYKGIFIEKLPDECGYPYRVKTLYNEKISVFIQCIPYTENAELINSNMSKTIMNADAVNELKKIFSSTDENNPQSAIKPEQKRGSILLDAHRIINGERQDQYGIPENSFDLIAKYWSTFLSGILTDPITPQDVAIMMTLLKIARISGGSYKEDSYTDACGYIALANDIVKNGNK